MKRLNRPAHDARRTLMFCAKSLIDKDFQARVTAVADEIEVAETTYKDCGSKASLYTIKEATSVGGGSVTMQEMRKLYKGTFSRKGSLPRRIYDEIKTAPGNAICPLCAQRDVSTLDHYLALTRHPALAVTPVNLVPACNACNKAKLDRQPSSAAEQTLHPYFDDVDDEVWLYANLIESVPPAFVFCSMPPTTWHPTKQARVCKHFQIFGLASLYSIHAAVELVNIRDGLMRIVGRGGMDDLRSHLAEQALSRKAVTKNSWQGAMYEALSKSEWFCKDGYKDIRQI